MAARQTLHRAKVRLVSYSEGFLALAATFLAYRVVEVLGGYGFLAVFVAARAIRAAEVSHEYQKLLHDFAEQVERLLTVLLLLLFGGAVVTGLLAELTWPAVDLALMLILVIRPLFGWLSLCGSPGSPAEQLGDRRVRHLWDRLVLLPGVRHNSGDVSGHGNDRPRRTSTVGTAKPAS